MKNNLGELMQQAQKMQENMRAAQAELADLTVQGESGAGMIRITMNGQHDVLRTEIDPNLLNGEMEILEDLISAAINDACQKVETASKEKMQKLTGGLNLPPGFKL